MTEKTNINLNCIYAKEKKKKESSSNNSLIMAAAKTDEHLFGHSTAVCPARTPES